MLNVLNDFPPFDPLEWAYRRHAVLGIPDSGKTYTAKALAERFMSAGVPIVALDPAGVWRHLRFGSSGKGFPVVVIGGAAPDIKLDRPDDAAEIMRAAMAANVSIIFDLYDPRLSKADWRRVVTAACHVLCYENKTLRHLFIEEAAEFAPQKVMRDVAHVYSEVERIVRMARNASVGVTLINQRAEELNKAVLELCENLFLHRQKGRRSLENLSKWLDFAEVQDDEAIRASVPNLEQGQCWAWISSAAPVLMKVPPLVSYHPRIGATVSAGATLIKPADTTEFVAKLKAALGEKKAPDSEAAAPVRRIAEVRVDDMAVKQAHEDGYRAGFAAGMEQARVIASDLVEDMTAGLAHDFNDRALGEIGKALAAVPPPRPRPALPAQVNGQGATAPGLSGPQTAVLEALGLWRFLGFATPSRAQVAAVAGYSVRSSTWQNLIGSMRSNGLIEYPDRGQIAIATRTHIRHMTTDEARDRLVGVLSGSERKLVEAFRRSKTGMARDELARRSGYSETSSTFQNLVGSLCTLGVLQKPSRGVVALAPWVGEIL